MDALVVLGDAAFPVYEEVLSDSETDAFLFSRTCYFISRVNADRRRFVPIAVRRLNDTDESIRFYAASLLGTVGNEQDAEALLPLLSEGDIELRVAAAKALARIGGKRELESMDAVLREGKLPDHGNRVKTCRDELEKRLKENPAPKGLMN